MQVAVLVEQLRDGTRDGAEMKLLRYKKEFMESRNFTEYTCCVPHSSLPYGCNVLG